MIGNASNDLSLKVQTAGASVKFFEGANLIGFFNYNGGGPYFQQYNGAGFRLIATNGDLELIAATASTNILFKPANATKATLLSTGNFRVGDNATPAETLDVGGRIRMDLSTAPATPVACGKMYLDATGNLHFIGALGTDTLIGSI